MQNYYFFSNNTHFNFFYYLCNMKHKFAFLAASLIILCCTTLCAQQQEIDARVDEIIAQLTLDEKLSLMVHQNPAIERVGLKPYSWWNEALHGVARAGTATVYPMPIALAATFNPSLVRDIFSDIAVEAHLKYQTAQDTGGYGDYTGLTFFTPNINIFRDPRWGRGMETYGEDPYLTAIMGLACVKGLQHPDNSPDIPASSLACAACLKHLAVHSGPEGIRHEFDSRVDNRDLRTTYLPAFEYIIKNSDVAQVMCGYNRLNGVPCCTSRELLVDILRNEWQYDGIIVTDCWALNDAYERDTVIPRHKTHPSAALAYADAFGTEVDLECGSGLPALRDAVRYGYIPESKIDEHVRRVLRTRLAVTSQTSPTRPTSLTSPTNPTAVAAQSMVLLKNNGVLPLKEGVALRLEGPNAYDSLMPLGNYNGTPEHCVTIGEALANAVGGSTTAKTVVGGSAADKTLIYAGGLNPQLEGEELPVEKEGFYKGDRTRIELPQEQVDEIKAFKAQGYRVVLLLCTGSAIALENVIDYCDAVLVGWYGGEAMGTAVKQLLFGEQDCFGRLPVTFYRNTAQMPSFESYDMQGRTYRYIHEAPLFPFGYGLSYSNYSLNISDISMADFFIEGMVSLNATAASQAESHRAVVQVYLKDTNDTEAPVKQLIGIASVAFGKGDNPRQPFRIDLDPFWFRQYNSATGMMEEPADGTRFILQVGFSSTDSDLTDHPFIYHNRK